MLDLNTLVLKAGSHPNRRSGVCVMEAVAWLAGEPHSDRPECASPVVAAFLRHLNDQMPPVVRQQLKPLIPRIAVSRASDAVERQRAYVAADYAVREAAPWALEAAGLYAEAASLRVCAPVVDAVTARVARAAARRAQAAATPDTAADIATGYADAAVAHAADAADADAETAASASATATYAVIAVDVATDARRVNWSAAIACAERMLAVTA